MMAKAQRRIMDIVYYGNIHYDDIFDRHRVTPFASNTSRGSLKIRSKIAQSTTPQSKASKTDRARTARTYLHHDLH
jgi:hypothetical protein